MSAINAALTGLFDLLLWPLSWAPAWLQLAVLSVPATVVMLLVFRFCSSQSGIERAKDLVKAYLLELWIYRDDLLVSLRAQGLFVLANLRYLGQLLLPIAVASVPILLMLVQVEARYRYRALDPGESAVLRVQVEGAPPTALDVALDVPAGLTRETPALRIDARGQIAWRLRADAPGEYEIGVRVGEQRLVKHAAVDRNGARLSTQLRRAGDPLALLHPLERPIASDGPVRAVTLDYPSARGDFLDLSSAGWIFVGFAFVLAFALRGAFGVTF